MLNTSKGVENSTRMKIMDKFAQKMLDSRHSLEATRWNLVTVLNGLERKKRKCARLGEGLHKSAKASSSARRMKKLTGK